MTIVPSLRSDPSSNFASTDDAVIRMRGWKRKGNRRRADSSSSSSSSSSSLSSPSLSLSLSISRSYSSSSSSSMSLLSMPSPPLDDNHHHFHHSYSTQHASSASLVCQCLNRLPPPSVKTEPMSKPIIAALARSAGLVIYCDPGSPTSVNFASNNSQLPPLPEFVEAVAIHSGASVVALVMAWIFLDRLKDRLPERAKAHRIFLASLLVASKCVSDVPIKNRAWANHLLTYVLRTFVSASHPSSLSRVFSADARLEINDHNISKKHLSNGGTGTRIASLFSLPELNLMERQFLQLIGFALEVSHSEVSGRVGKCVGTDQAIDYDSEEAIIDRGHQFLTSLLPPPPSACTCYQATSSNTAFRVSQHRPLSSLRPTTSSNPSPTSFMSSSSTIRGTLSTPRASSPFSLASSSTASTLITSVFTAHKTSHTPPLPVTALSSNSLLTPSSSNDALPPRITATSSPRPIPPIPISIPLTFSTHLTPPFSLPLTKSSSSDPRHRTSRTAYLPSPSSIPTTPYLFPTTPTTPLITPTTVSATFSISPIRTPAIPIPQSTLSTSTSSTSISPSVLPRSSSSSSIWPWSASSPHVLPRSNSSSSIWPWPSSSPHESLCPPNVVAAEPVTVYATVRSVRGTSVADLKALNS
ncbi:hypothetical protein BC829DRAFT_444988 [Chytridium lagenaria]|nr:hypothetical protein BC829DRAFT_444988 [Chytridium lagenaria]